MCSTWSWGRRKILCICAMAAYDPHAQNELYELVSKLNRNGISIIMVSHDISSALKYASHILHISKKQLFFGTKSDYIKSSTGMKFLESEVASDE